LVLVMPRATRFWVLALYMQGGKRRVSS